jgi:hypothetical protein
MTREVQTVPLPQDHQGLTKAATECLAKAFRGDDVPVHVVQAAVAILLTPRPLTPAEPEPEYA